MRVVALNAALTLFATSIVTVQVVSRPLHAPSQPMNVAFAAGVAVSVTSDPSSSFAVQVLPPVPHWIPPPATVPGPVTVTVSEFLPGTLGAVVNVAVTLFAAFIVTEQVVEAPVQAPPHPLNVAPVSGVAVNVIVDPEAWLTVQVVSPEPQLMPPPVTVPSPVTETPSGKSVAGPPAPWPVKAAVTLFAAFIVTEQLGEGPLQEPPQPVKLAPEPGCAVSVMVVFAGSSELQLEPPEDVHEIPPPATTPLPVTETVSAKVVAAFVNPAFTAVSVLSWTVQLVSVPGARPAPAGEVVTRGGALDDGQRRAGVFLPGAVGLARVAVDRAVASRDRASLVVRVAGDRDRERALARAGLHEVGDLLVLVRRCERERAHDVRAAAVIRSAPACERPAGRRRGRQRDRRARARLEIALRRA